jgi:hypothetical protein
MIEPGMCNTMLGVGLGVCLWLHGAPMDLVLMLRTANLHDLHMVHGVLRKVHAMSAMTLSMFFSNTARVDDAPSSHCRWFAAPCVAEPACEAALLHTIWANTTHK